MHLSPGMATLLGTGADDRMRIEHGFTTLLGGRGRDTFEGSAASRQIEKFYGGEGDDIFRWSPGFNIVHGGQPQLAYASDGTDVIDYSGAGEVTITFNRHWIPHKVPNFVAVFERRHRPPVLGRAHPVERQDRPHRARQGHRPLGGRSRLAAGQLARCGASARGAARRPRTRRPARACIGTEGDDTIEATAPPTIRSTAAAETTR